MIALLVNPAAGSGRAAHRASEVARALRAVNEVRVFTTRARGDEQRCVHDAVQQGATVLAVVGGDGSVHHTVRGLLAARATVPLAIFAAGTGNDFVKTLGTPSHDVAAMTACVAGGRHGAIDVGTIDDVPFVNAAGVGFDVDVLQRMRTAMLLRGTAAYVWTALRALGGYRGFVGTLSSGGHVPTPLRHRLMTVFANGRCFGGAFRIAPQAELQDGCLDVIDIGHVPPVARPWLFVKAVRGRHLQDHGVHVHRGAAYTLTLEAPPMFEADGELYRARSSTLEVRVRSATVTVIMP